MNPFGSSEAKSDQYSSTIRHCLGRGIQPKAGHLVPLHDSDLADRTDRFLICMICLMLPRGSRTFCIFYNRFPRMDLCCTDPARRLMTAG